MNKKKPLVFLPGASGSMGYETFKLLWEKRDHYDIVLLQRPSKTNKQLFRKYEKEAGIEPVKGKGVVQGVGLKIVWGDATCRDDVFEACKGIDWCLCCLALISPEADRHPEEALRVNSYAIKCIVEAIEDQDPDHICMVYVGTIAEYGDRLPPIHQGRVGDPLLPSVFDMYAYSKILGERAVMESNIKHWVSLRQTFIMIPELFSLMDPIMFHQPIDSFMECIAAKDSGRIMMKCLDVDSESKFWRRCFNVSGGPACRTTYLELLDRVFSMTGIDYRKVMERKWFALKNFHMQFFEDAHLLNDHLDHWKGRQSMEDYYDEVWSRLPVYLKLVARLNKFVPPVRWIAHRFTKLKLRKLACSKNGAMVWIKSGDRRKIEAFYGSKDAFENIPGWGVDMPSLDHHMDYVRLNHGYDENKVRLTLKDLDKAAEFRGGRLISRHWDGNLFTKLSWSCCQDHAFDMSPNAVLKAGHWCTACIGPPWNYDYIAEKSEFFRQVWRGRTG